MARDPGQPRRDGGFSLARAATGLLLACLAACENRDAGGTGRVVFLGDSITAGYGLPPNQAYPALVQEKINAERPGYVAVNAGVSGDTTADGLQRVDGLLGEPVAVFVAALGVNDAEDGLPAAAAEANLQRIMEKVREAYPKAELVIAGIALPKLMSPGQIAEYGAMFRRVADRNGAALIADLVAGVAGRREMNQPDGIHPNAAGQREVASTVWEVLRGLL
jgi:acyl-CoA thioesterase-1